MQGFQDVTVKIQSFVKSIQQAIGTNQPKAKKYMNYEETRGGASITVPRWFNVFETGRGKRKTNNTESAKDARFSSAFEERLFYWMKRQGMLKGTPKHQVNQAKGLRYLINQKGTKLFRAGGRKDVMSNVITEQKLNELTKEIGKLSARITVDEYFKL